MTWAAASAPPWVSLAGGNPDLRPSETTICRGTEGWYPHSLFQKGAHPGVLVRSFPVLSFAEEKLWVTQQVGARPGLGHCLCPQQD